MQKNKNKKNREMMYVTYLFVAIFLCMIGYLVYFTAMNKETLINNSYNPRQKMLAEQNTRGKIVARGGEILAETIEDDNGKEVRKYPYDNLFVHSVGYATYGKTGLESQYNYYLINSNIPFSQKAANESSGKKNPGDNVYTTLDVKLQQIADQALGIYSGAVVALNPKTGEILAMVSKPDFDPNKIQDLWEDLVKDEESGVLLNRVSQGLYPPGSTFKIITALQYIRENPDTYTSYSYECNGSFTHEGEKISCYHGSKHGSEDLVKSFAKSCNSSFANMALLIDRAGFADTLDRLYFNKEIPVDFIYHKSSLLVDAATTDDQMMQNAIGQGKTQMTPLHLAMITASVANQGTMMTPYLMERIESEDGVEIKKNSPKSLGTVMSESEAAVVKELMEAVVTSGTGTKLLGASYSAAGKTGSAEYSGDKEESHAWFTGFAPAEDPEIVVTVIIEGAGSGGDYAVPVAKRVFDGYFKE